MKLRARIALATLCVVTALGFCLAANAQTTKAAEQPSKSAEAALSPADVARIQQRVETFLRSLYAWGTDFEVKAGPLTPAPAAGLYQTSVTVSADGGSDSATVYVTKDGRFIFRGDLQDMTVDPLAETLKQLHLDGYASKGPADAKVVVVEFGDFECPSCRQLDQVLRTVLPQYPQVRFVFKDFPLEQIHPWAITGAIAGRCALQQSSDVFWKLHDAIYDSQDLISPDNAHDKLTDLATTAGAEPVAFRTCMADPKMADAIHQSMEEGKTLQITGTPTVFVDGRRFVGPDPNLLNQFIKFDLKADIPAK
jgi:protein-disulfide isomerase